MKTQAMAEWATESNQASSVRFVILNFRGIFKKPILFKCKQWSFGKTKSTED